MLDSRALYTRHLLTEYTRTHLTSRHLHALGLDFISLYSLYPFAAYDTHSNLLYTCYTSLHTSGNQRFLIIQSGGRLSNQH